MLWKDAPIRVAGGDGSGLELTDLLKTAGDVAGTLSSGPKIRHIELVWPGKSDGAVPRQEADGQWTLEPSPDHKRLCPLIGLRPYPPTADNDGSLVISGDRIDTLYTLARGLPQGVRLAYLDMPRIEVDDKTTAFRGDPVFAYSTWLSVLRAHLLAVEPIVSRNGVVVVHTGDIEEPYARLVAEEIFGRENRVATIVWQRGYAPRFALEFVVFGGAVAVVLYLLQTRETLDQVFPILAVYAVAANKLIPSLQSVFTALPQIRFNAANLDDLYQDMVRARMAPSCVTTARAIGVGPAEPEGRLRPIREIRVEGVSFRYPRAEGSALTDVSLVIPANQTVAFVGSSGSGKTTLADLLLGLLVPTQGEILVDGMRLGPENVNAWRRSVGYVPQTIFLADESIAKNIAFCIPDDLIDYGAVQEAARAAHLEPFVSKLPHGYDTPVGERGVRISGGQRQRIGIARALYHSPAVLILDEATSALDSITENVIMQAIRDLARTRTIILIAHRLTTVEACDRVYLIENGRMVSEGTYEELIASNPTFRAMART